MKVKIIVARLIIIYIVFDIRILSFYFSLNLLYYNFFTWVNLNRRFSQS